jgi:protein-S-isoprenylcysteine O-methyltransferase Ste14
MTPPPFAWPYALFFWAVYLWAFIPEMRIIGRAREGARNADSRDQGSIRVMIAAMSIALVLAFPLAFIDRSSFPATICPGLFIAGLVLLVLGSLLRRYCWRTLGEYFTGDVQARAGQPVISAGPYRLVRHPSYSGGLLMNFGIGLALCSWLSFGLLTVTAVATYVYRVRIEERALLEAIGEPYRTYMQERKRFIPYII